MYLEHFKLKRQPFELSPDPDYLYLGRIHERAKSYMESIWDYPDGIISFSGAIGTGKTTLIKSYLRKLADTVCVATVDQTQFAPKQFLQFLLVQFGFKPVNKRKAEILEILNGFLAEKFSGNTRTLIVIDDAQNLSKNVLKEIGKLFDDGEHEKKALRIFLSGSPELNDAIDSAGIQELVRLRLHISPLSRDDTRSYVFHRLTVAGATNREIFSDKAVELISRYSGGIPQLINTLCDTAMTGAATQGQASVSKEIVLAAVDELQWREATSDSEEDSVLVPVLNVPDAKRYGVLSISYRGRTTNEFPLYMGKLLIGRSDSNDLQIASHYISTHHAQIITDADGKSLIEDLNSTNGLYLGDRKVKYHKLKPGDKIGLGQHTMTYFKERRALARKRKKKLNNRTGRAQDSSSLRESPPYSSSLRR